MAPLRRPRRLFSGEGRVLRNRLEGSARRRGCATVPRAGFRRTRGRRTPARAAGVVGGARRGSPVRRGGVPGRVALAIAPGRDGLRRDPPRQVPGSPSAARVAACRARRRSVSKGSARSARTDRSADTDRERRKGDDRLRRAPRSSPSGRRVGGPSITVEQRRCGGLPDRPGGWAVGRTRPERRADHANGRPWRDSAAVREQPRGTAGEMGRGQPGGVRRQDERGGESARDEAHPLRRRQRRERAHGEHGGRSAPHGDASDRAASVRADRGDATGDVAGRRAPVQPRRTPRERMGSLGSRPDQHLRPERASCSPRTSSSAGAPVTVVGSVLHQMQGDGQPSIIAAAFSASTALLASVRPSWRPRRSRAATRRCLRRYAVVGA